MEPYKQISHAAYLCNDQVVFRPKERIGSFGRGVGAKNREGVRKSGGRSRMLPKGCQSCAGILAALAHRPPGDPGPVRIPEALGQGEAV